jgi:hypothetical protein
MAESVTFDRTQIVAAFFTREYKNSILKKLAFRQCSACSNVATASTSTQQASSFH